MDDHNILLPTQYDSTVGTPSMAVTAGSTEAAEAQTVQSQRPRTGES